MVERVILMLRRHAQILRGANAIGPVLLFVAVHATASGPRVWRQMGRDGTDDWRVHNQMKLAVIAPEQPAIEMKALSRGPAGCAPWASAPASAAGEEGPQLSAGKIGCRGVQAGALALALTIGVVATAAAADTADEWPKAPFAARSGAFGVVQVATTDPAGFIRDWSKPGLGAHLKITHSARRGQEVDVFVNFRGCRGDRKARCHVSGDFTVRGPSGATFAHKRIQVWPGLPKPALGVVSLGREQLSLVVKGDDALGDYRVIGVVTDEVAKRPLRTVQTITVRP
jgi:hypothetical protein